MFWPTIRYVALTNLTNRWSYFLARRRARDSYAGGATQRRWQLAETKPQPQPERAAPAKSCGQIERLAQSATHSRSWKIDSIRRTVRIPVKARLRIQLPGAILSSRWSERFMEIYWLQFKPTSVWIKKQTTSPSYLNINAMEYSRIQTMLLIMIGESSLWDRPSPAICTDIVSIYAECRYIKAAINKSRTSIC